MSLKELHTLGIDIGSTTVKIAVLNAENEVLFSDSVSYTHLSPMPAGTSTSS